MNRTYKIFLFIFVLVLAWLTYLEANQPQPVNWNPGYKATSKIPLGSYVLFENLKEGELKIQKVNTAPYLFLNENSPEGTYFFLNDQLTFDDAELDKLLKWVEKGNTLFLATDAFSKNLLDTLNLNVGTAIPQEGISSKPMVNLTQEEFKSKEPYLFDHETYHSVFIEIDTLQHTVLGISQLYSDTLKITSPEINFIKQDFGKGQIFLSTSPQTFSNYFLLEDDNFEYAEKALAYLPQGNTLYWDTYYKAGKTFQTSPLYILLNNKSLKWAYYFVIFGSLFFILFEGKRKQRSIPVINPLKNQTFEFTRTISGLYLEKREFHSIATKKINLFLETIRNQYRLPTEVINGKFYKDLAEISGNSTQETKELFSLIQEIKNKENLSREELLNLNSTINSFKNKNNGK